MTQRRLEADTHKECYVNDVIILTAIVNGKLDLHKQLSGEKPTQWILPGEL